MSLWAFRACGATALYAAARHRAPEGSRPREAVTIANARDQAVSFEPNCRRFAIARLIENQPFIHLRPSPGWVANGLSAFGGPDGQSRPSFTKGTVIAMRLTSGRSAATKLTPKSRSFRAVDRHRWVDC